MERRVMAVVAEGQAALATLERIAPVAAGAGHELGDAADRTEPLRVVVVPIQHDRRVAAKRLPERLDVGLVAVRARAEAPAVPEGDPARAATADPGAQPAELRRARAVVCLGVEAQNLPAADARGVPARDRPAAHALPVAAVARAGVVVPGGRQGAPREAAVSRRVVAREVAVAAPLIDVAEVEEALRRRAQDAAYDLCAIGAAVAVPDGPDRGRVRRGGG